MSTPEERLTRIENSVDAIAEHQARLEVSVAHLEASVAQLEGSVAQLEVTVETSFHEQHLRILKITQFQSSLMESQNSAWKAIEMLGGKVDRLTDNVDRLIGFQGGNGDS